MRHILVRSVLALSLTSVTASAGDVPIANPPTFAAQTLLGTGNKPGLMIVRIHLPADGLMKPHIHDVDRHVYVLSGTLSVCTSTTVSAAKVVAHKAGEFFTEPANQVHCSWANDGDVDYLEINNGPMTTKFVDK